MPTGEYLRTFRTIITPCLQDQLARVVHGLLDCHFDCKYPPTFRIIVVIYLQGQGVHDRCLDWYMVADVSQGHVVESINELPNPRGESTTMFRNVGNYFRVEAL